MTTVAIIQARMTSTRFPGKVLRELDGRPLLAWVVRSADAVPGVDKVVVATSDNDTDTPIAVWCAAAEVSCFRGSEQDVLERFQKAAALESAEIILRLTADCPFLDPQVCGQVIALLKRAGADYACNTDPASWPDGLDCWAVTRETLETAGREAKRPSEREHVLSYIRHNRKQFDCVGLNCPIPGLQMERWTVDTPDDLQFVSEVARRLDSSETPPSHLEILE
ncbi:MAG: glycosyltransferase family protein, partial [Pseudomonadota bacterium]|nr:glycosyltransferase family protein [Pseudomonadota bacterium]